MTNFLNALTAVISAALAGALFGENKAAAILVIITAFLFAIGYFFPGEKNKKSVM